MNWPRPGPKRPGFALRNTRQLKSSDSWYNEVEPRLINKDAPVTSHLTSPPELVYESFSKVFTERRNEKEAMVIDPTGPALSLLVITITLLSISWIIVAVCFYIL